MKKIEILLRNTADHNPHLTWTGYTSTPNYGDIWNTCGGAWEVMGWWYPEH